MGILVGATDADVEIVAGMHRLLSAGAEEYAEVGFIGSLIGRESGIAIDAIGAVFGCEWGDLVVVFAYFGDKFGTEVEPLLLYILVARFVGVKPLTIIVLREIAHELHDFFHLPVNLIMQK